MSPKSAPEFTENSKRRVTLPFTGLYIKSKFTSAAIVIVAALGSKGVTAQSTPSASVLSPDKFAHYSESFGQADEELHTQFVPNSGAWDFLSKNIPLFECPDPDIERTYYFRWWTYRKHLKETPDGVVVTEFLPKVSWAGKHNTINAAAGHHVYEGRWLRDPRFLDSYEIFWFSKGGNGLSYSWWMADAVYERFLVTGDKAHMLAILPSLIGNYREWEKKNFRPAVGLYWQIDDRDGMEMSAGGSGFRLPLNSYQYGNAVAIANMAKIAGQPDVAAEFQKKADDLKKAVQAKLWDAKDEFFKTLPATDKAAQVKVRELQGFTPWYFNLPDASYSSAWKQFRDPQGFSSPFGPTTVEQRSPSFQLDYKGHPCKWNGPSWPFATSITLTAMANLLNDYQQTLITKADYFQALQAYARSQQRKRSDGAVVPWIDENLNPKTGEWISRSILEERGFKPESGGKERGRDYNHSTFCDLVINGLVGLRPRADNVIEVNPLVPNGKWDYFCLEGVLYHGKSLTIMYDRTGRRYNQGVGLKVLADGKLLASSPTLTRVKATLPNQ